METAGAVTGFVGTLGVAALVKTCVDNLEYIQLGRHFSQNYGRCQTKLRVSQLRLSRWATAAGIYDNPIYTRESTGDETVEEIKYVVEEIDELIHTVRKASMRYEKRAHPGDLVLCRDADMPSASKRVCGQLQMVVRQRQRDTVVSKKITWALYDAKYFDKLLRELSEFIDMLEKICPVEEVRRRLAQQEVGAIDDQAALDAIADAASEIDPLLLGAASQKTPVKNRAERSTAENKATFQVGNSYGEVVSKLSLLHKTDNSTYHCEAKGLSKIMVGNRYGRGKDIFD